MSVESSVEAESSIESLENKNGSQNLSARPSLAQLKTLIFFIEKHPELVNKKNKYSAKYKKHWLEITNNLNQLQGARKSLKGWVKFWTDKTRLTQVKKQHIQEGRVKSALSLLEHKILDLSDIKSRLKKKKAVKQEPCNGEDSIDTFDLHDDVFIKTDNPKDFFDISTEADVKQINMLEKMVDVMDQQAAALTQVAQASLTNSEALEKIADASHLQAVAVERLVGTFETISASAHDIRNAVLGIDYTLKRCYPAEQRQTSTLFS